MEDRDDIAACESGLRGLVDHRVAVEAHDTLETVHRVFRQTGCRYMAVLGDRRVIGVCASGHVLDVLSGRYGFALASRALAHEHRSASHLAFHADAPLLEVLERVFARRGAEFNDDVVVVDDDGALVGLIETRTLVLAQSRVVHRQFGLVESQRLELETVNKSLAQMLRQQQELERRLIRKEKAALVETLAGGVAHEINNKLLPIIGYAEMMLDEADTTRYPQFRDYCETVLQSALDSGRIIKQLLQLSRPARAELRPANLLDVIREALTLVQLRVREAAVTLIVDLPGSPVPVHIDSGQFKQVVVNLLLNALDAMEGSPTRRIVLRVLTNHSTVTMTVADTGTGIPEVIRERVFDPFFTTKRPDKGTGLGLSVCLTILKQHGGDINVESADAGGASFHVTLPLADTTESQIEGPAQPSSCPVPAPVGGVVLVVDDEEGVAGFVGAALRTRLGCEVHLVANGQQAIDALEATSFSAILSDVRMPVVNGVELHDWVQIHRPELVSRMVFTTGDASGSDLNGALESRGCQILRKPFGLDAVVSRVRGLIPAPSPAADRLGALLARRRPVLAMTSSRAGRHQERDLTNAAV